MMSNNLYDDNQSNNNYNEPNKPTNDSSVNIIWSIFYILLSITAIWLAIRCNRTSVADLLCAVFFPPFYIIYSYIAYNGLCEKDII